MTGETAIYNLVTVIVDETDAKAQAKFEEYRRYTSYDGSLVFMSGWTGVDFGQYAPTDLVKKVETNAIVSAIEHLAGGAKSWTIDELAAWGGIGGMGPVFVGSAATVADILQTWVEETGVDGFNLAYAVAHETSRISLNIWCLNCSGAAFIARNISPGRCAKNCSARDACCRPGIPVRGIGTSRHSSATKRLNHWLACRNSGPRAYSSAKILLPSMRMGTGVRRAPRHGPSTQTPSSNRNIAL